MAGPSFRFRLERVRALRERAEDEAKEAFAGAMMDRVRSEQEMEDAAQRVAQAREAQLDATAAPISAIDLMARQAYLERSERAHQASRDDLNRRDQAVEERREELTEAARDRQALERLKENRRIEFVSVSRRASRPPTSTRSRSTASAGGQHELRHRIGVADAGRHRRGSLRRHSLERARCGQSRRERDGRGRHAARRGLSAPGRRSGDKSADRGAPPTDAFASVLSNQVARTALAEGQSKQTSTKGGKRDGTDADASGLRFQLAATPGRQRRRRLRCAAGRPSLIPPH